jgi:hypothetical protein
MRKTRTAGRILGAAVGIALGITPVQPSWAASSVSVSAVLDGSMATVSGVALIDIDSPWREIVTDPPLDGNITSRLAPVGGDLLGFSLRSKANGDLALQWKLGALPSPFGTPGLVYAFAFRVSGVPYQVVGAAVSATDPSPTSKGWLLRCREVPSLTCVPGTSSGGVTTVSTNVAVTFEAAQATVTAVVPRSALSNVLAQGAVLEPFPPSPTWDGGVNIELGDLYQRFCCSDSGAGTATYTYGITVDLAVGDASDDPQSLSYQAPASVAGNGSFSGAIAAASGQAVFARACLGGENCVYGRSDPLS